MDHVSDPLGTESHKPKPRPDLMYIYIYRTTVASSCDLNAPRCTTEVLWVRLQSFTRVPGRCLRWSPTPPRDPGDPPQYMKNDEKGSITEVLHLIRCYTHRGLYIYIRVCVCLCVYVSVILCNYIYSYSPPAR